MCFHDTAIAPVMMTKVCKAGKNRVLVGNFTTWPITSKIGGELKKRGESGWKTRAEIRPRGDRERLCEGTIPILTNAKGLTLHECFYKETVACTLEASLITWEPGLLGIHGQAMQDGS